MPLLRLTFERVISHPDQPGQCCFGRGQLCEWVISRPDQHTSVVVNFFESVIFWRSDHTMEDSNEEASHPISDEVIACEDGAARCDSRRSFMKSGCYVIVLHLTRGMIVCPWHKGISPKLGEVLSPSSLLENPFPMFRVLLLNCIPIAHLLCMPSILRLNPANGR
jgi:hypothetical protein